MSSGSVDELSNEERAPRIIRPYLMMKPYSVPQIGTVTASIRDSGLIVTDAYFVRDWVRVAREIYRRDCEANPSFRLGLEGHMHLVNLMYGNTGIVMFVGQENLAEYDLVSDFERARSVKTMIRNALPGGENLADLVVFMNLQVHKVQADYSGIPVGKLGIWTDEGEFVQMGGYGNWDNYFFKYIHAPDSIEHLTQDVRDFERLGLFGDENKIDPKAMDFMLSNKVFLPPEVLNRLL